MQQPQVHVVEFRHGLVHQLVYCGRSVSGFAEQTGAILKQVPGVRQQRRPRIDEVQSVVDAVEEGIHAGDLVHFLDGAFDGLVHGLQEDRRPQGFHLAGHLGVNFHQGVDHRVDVQNVDARRQAVQGLLELTEQVRRIELLQGFRQFLERSVQLVADNVGRFEPGETFPHLVHAFFQEFQHPADPLHERGFQGVCDGLGHFAREIDVRDHRDGLFDGRLDRIRYERGIDCLHSRFDIADQGNAFVCGGSQIQVFQGLDDPSQNSVHLFESASNGVAVEQFRDLVHGIANGGDQSFGIETGGGGGYGVHGGFDALPDRFHHGHHLVVDKAFNFSGQTFQGALDLGEPCRCQGRVQGVFHRGQQVFEFGPHRRKGPLDFVHGVLHGVSHGLQRAGHCGQIEFVDGVGDVLEQVVGGFRQVFQQSPSFFGDGRDVVGRLQCPCNRQQRSGQGFVHARGAGQGGFLRMQREGESFQFFRRCLDSSQFAEGGVRVSRENLGPQRHEHFGQRGLRLGQGGRSIGDLASRVQDRLGDAGAGHADQFGGHFDGAGQVRVELVRGHGLPCGHGLQGFHGFVDHRQVGKAKQGSCETGGGTLQVLQQARGVDMGADVLHDAPGLDDGVMKVVRVGQVRDLDSAVVGHAAGTPECAS